MRNSVLRHLDAAACPLCVVGNISVTPYTLKYLCTGPVGSGKRSLAGAVALQLGVQEQVEGGVFTACLGKHPRPEVCACMRGQIV